MAQAVSGQHLTAEASLRFKYISSRIFIENKCGTKKLSASVLRFYTVTINPHMLFTHLHLMKFVREEQTVEDWKT
jgi:hypothetical protein